MDPSVVEALVLGVSGLGVTVYHGTGLLIVLGGWSWIPAWAATLMGGPYPIEGRVRRVFGAVYLTLMSLLGVSVLVLIPMIAAGRGGLASPASWVVLAATWALTGGWFGYLVLRRGAVRPSADR